MTTPDWSRQIATWADEWHGDLVKFLARRMTTPADAQDLAQEVYLRLLRVDRLDLIRQPRSYLLRIAANLLHEWRLKARQSEPHLTELLDAMPAHQDTELEVDAGLREQRLAAELDRLPTAARIALVLHIRDGMSNKEIATKMNVTTRMVKRYLLTAYSRLRARVPHEL